MTTIDEPKGNNNPFLEKTIENWLTSVNELGYQLPFCELLLSEGYTVCHSSKQNAFEQGKDVIAIDKDGTPCGFQLKGGKITLTRWRDEVKSGVEELIDYKIVHPTVDKTKKHISVLVTNGDLDDTVKSAIDNLNEGKWKEHPLRVWPRGYLLRKFVELSGNFTPQEPSDYKSFLDLYFSDGKELMDESKFSNFISGVLRLNEMGLSKEERLRNITSAVLFTGYIISPFKIENNHISIIQTLTLLSAHILSLAEKYNLEERYWLDSIEIVWMELMITSQLLQDEINDEGMTKLINSIWDGELGIYRRNLASAYLFAFKIAQLIEGNPKWREIATEEFSHKLTDSLTVWGEASFVPFILVHLFYKSASPEDPTDSFMSLYTALDTILMFNGRKSKIGLLSSYYGISDFIKMRFGLLDEPIDESFTGRSFMIKPIVDLLVRNDKREQLEQRWRGISYMSTEEFLPDSTWMHFLWRCNEGENRALFSKQEQSWNELKESAMSIDLNLVPKVLRDLPRLLPFYLLVYPHRVTTNYVKFLDETIAPKCTS